MSIKISWDPSPEPDMASYDIQRADVLSGPWILIHNIPHLVPGPDYDPVTHQFWWEDPTGDLNKYYRLVAIDLAGNHSVPSDPFQPIPTEPAIPNNTKVDHNYGGSSNLRYLTASGTPVEAAVIRVFRKSDYDQGRTDVALATTHTDPLGGWALPVFLTAGYSYVLVFAKEGLYGPDKVEITV
jgi:hypothetical protein